MPYNSVSNHGNSLRPVKQEKLQSRNIPVASPFLSRYREAGGSPDTRENDFRGDEWAGSKPLGTEKNRSGGYEKPAVPKLNWTIFLGLGIVQTDFWILYEVYDFHSENIPQGSSHLVRVIMEPKYYVFGRWLDIPIWEYDWMPRGSHFFSLFLVGKKMLEFSRPRGRWWKTNAERSRLQSTWSWNWCCWDAQSNGCRT